MQSSRIFKKGCSRVCYWRRVHLVKFHCSKRPFNLMDGYTLRRKCAFSHQTARLYHLMGCFELTILSDLMEAPEINKAICVSNQTLIFVKLCELSPGYEISALIHLLLTLSSTCIAYFETRSWMRPCMCDISAVSVLGWERGREKEKDWISSSWRSATTKAISLPCPQIAISYGTEIEYCTRYKTLVFYQAVEDVWLSSKRARNKYGTWEATPAIINALAIWARIRAA